MNEIIENDFYENIVNLAEENQPEANENFVSDEISEEEAAEFIDQLIESQVIIPAISPNVTGEDFIKIFNYF